MIFLIRQRNPHTGKIHDVKMAAPELLIGARADQQIYLRGAGIDNHHASIGQVAGKPILKAFGESGASVNGKSTRRSALQTGDEINIGQHRIRVMAAPPGFDFACELTRDDEQFAESFNSNWLQDVTVQSWTPRRVAYSLAALLFALTLLWPYSAYLEGTSENPAPWQDLMTARTETGEQAFRSDSLWSPGPLIAAHRNAIGNDCSSCHTDAFQPVADTACAVCHDQSAQHFDDYFHQEVIASGIAAVTTGLPRCESCHKEHNEPQTIIANSDSLCTQCHESSFTTTGGSITAVATAFNPESHPEFRYSMLVSREVEGDDQSQQRQTMWQRLTQPANTVAVENSNLEFSHELHLELDEPTLSCSNCHQLDVDNEHFKPITMQQHCAECHKLEFNGREIPHGDPALAVRAIEEYFIALYVTPGRGAPQTPRRLPGRQERTCEGTDFECAVAAAELEIELQFNNSGCVTCHRVTARDNPAIPQAASTDGWSPLSQTWHVEPVRINDDWYDKTRFDHVSHFTGTGRTDNEICSGCHEAQSSTLSSDVLIPRSATCFTCHSDSDRNNRIPMGCIDCHRHHTPGSVQARMNQ